MSSQTYTTRLASQRALADLKKAWASNASSGRTQSRLPKTTWQRRESETNVPIILSEILGTNLINGSKKETVLYLAYGSNLSAETFKGARGIKPISAVNVLVPSLALTFDLRGIPYTEPCFANTRLRDVSEAQTADYHKDRWHKGLVGVVYEVTLEDYATIIATEGGGASYQDIVVSCYEIPAGTRVVDAHPTTVPFTAHTLFSPQLPGEKSARDGRTSRPDPSYAQASARYLKLISDGAEEHELPQDYQDFIYNLRPYTITTKRQMAGQAIFLGIWMPFILALFGLGRVLADKHGKTPSWFQIVQLWIFAGMWLSYDAFCKKVFGDGERTEKKNGKDVEAGLDEKRPLLQ